LHAMITRNKRPVRNEFALKMARSGPKTEKTVSDYRPYRAVSRGWALRPMFSVTETEAAAIRRVFEEEGELSAMIELRRHFPGITDNVQARDWARTIAGWKPLRPVKRMPRLRRER
jgi:hypothetical protein